MQEYDQYLPFQEFSNMIPVESSMEMTIFTDVNLEQPEAINETPSKSKKRSKQKKAKKVKRTSNFKKNESDFSDEDNIPLAVQLDCSTGVCSYF